MKPRSAAFWYDRFPHRRRPDFPRLRTSTETRIAIVGGGLTGCACALAFAAARMPVVLLEADHVGAGATGGALGLIREDFDALFSAASAAYGLRAARTLWQGMRRASLEFSATLRRLGIRCDLAPQDLLHVAGAVGPAPRDAGRTLRRDYDARRAAGLEHRWMTALNLRRAAAVEGSGAIRTTGAVIDPYSACVGLANAAVKRGAEVFERTEVRRIRWRGSAVEVVTSAGTVTAETVVVATGAPFPDLRQLRRHLRPRHGYGVVTEPLAAPVRRDVGPRATALRDSSAPPHFVRWLEDDRVMVCGGDQDPVPERLRASAITQRTGQLMYELSLLYPAISGTLPAWGWTYAFDETLDGLPYLGPHRNFPRHLFALGTGRHGPGASWLAARLFVRHVAGEPAKGDDLFGFSRILTGPAHR